MINNTTILELTSIEKERQANTLNLIASENYPSQAVLNLGGSVWNNKYGEGYAGKRYYAGNENTDKLESFVQSKALEVFKAQEEYGVNVQVLSGSPANAMVFLSVLEQGDTVLSLNLANGGHLSHMHATSNWNKFFKMANYDVKEILEENGETSYIIDVEDYKQKIIDIKPKLVIIGFSAYTKKYDFAPLVKFAHENGCLVLADIAHINGLVAAQLHPTPFSTSLNSVEGADFVSMTTHKTFRGPRGAILFAKNYIPEYIDRLRYPSITHKSKSLIELINKTVFPGTSGGPHFSLIAGIGQACLEILDESKYNDSDETFVNYSKRVLVNAVALEDGIRSTGIEIISPTQNHIVLFKLPNNVDSLIFQQLLENYNIITNRNMLPNDTKSAFRPSGMRLGSPALTSKGITKDNIYTLGQIIGQLAINFDPENIDQDIVKKIEKIIQSLTNC